MPPRSNVEKLAPELRSKINDLLADPNVTQAEIATMVNSWAGEEVVSKSGVNRYAAQMAKFTERSRQATMVAEVFVRRIGKNTGNVLGQVILEQLRLMVFDLITAIEDIRESGEAGATEAAVEMLAKVTKSLNNLERADKLNAERSQAIRAEALQEAAAIVEKSAASEGLSQAVADQIKTKILGL